MLGPEREQPARELQILRRKHEDSNTMLAIVMAGIAGLVILGGVVAYNYASDNTIASNPNPAPVTRSADAPPATIGASRPSETTGSGNVEQPVTVKPDHSQRQR